MTNTTKTKEALKSYYEALSGKYEGYVQMSDSRFKDEHVFYKKSSLPSWGILHHNDVNYILEMALFDGKTSILIRQHNAGFLVIEKELDGDEPIDSFCIVTNNTLKMKIAQIWEEVPSEFCLNMSVLEPKYLMFVGFEESKGGES